MASAGWQLAGFDDRFEAWVAQENPDADTRTAVLAWIMNRYTNPYRGARREPGFPNVWWARIPGTATAQTAVVCSFAVEEQSKVVVCYSIATLNQPI